MDYFLLIFTTLLGLVCSIFLIVWGIKEFNSNKLGLLIPSLIFGFLTLLMSIFNFHQVSVEQGKDKLREELIKENYCIKSNAMDVYQGKTTLQRMIVDGELVDSVVIYKNMK